MASRKLPTRKTAIPTTTEPVWLKNMNDEQKQVILHHEGPLCVLAQAGSGKTRALVHRIVRMVEELGVNPEKILAVTFSKKAADEMSARCKELGVEARIGTWHSLCLEIIKTDQLPESRWVVDESDKAKFVLKEVLGYKGLDWKGSDLNELRSFIGWCKANLIEANTPESKEIAKEWFGLRDGRLADSAYTMFEQKIAQAGLLTFDDFLMVVWRHLSRNEQARSQWASKWSYVLQDEAQDANKAQIVIASLLAKDHKNYMVVGDPGQSIYGFRGSDPSYLLEFVEQWQASRVAMCRNYRSGSSIINAANKVIQKGVVKLEEDMIPMRGHEGSATTVFAENLDDEANKFVQFVQEGVLTGEQDYSAFTCLFRTNAQSRAVEESLLSAKIPYVVVGGSSFYERKEVRDLLAYLRVAANRDQHGENVKRCINAPFRFLGAKFVEKLMIVASGRNNPDWEQLVMTVAQKEGIQARQRSSAIEWSEMISYVSEMINDPPMFEQGVSNPSTPESILQHIVQVTQYNEWLEKEEGSEGLHNNPLSNVRELIRVASRFSTVIEFLDYIDKSIAEAKKQRADSQAGGNRVLLMSIHRSKGLEWPNVWILGCNENILPHARGDEDEERRLMYVAMTRARENLRCSYVQSIAVGAAIKELPPSRFLADSGLISLTA